MFKIIFQAEKLSYINFLNALLIIPMAFLWAYIPNEEIAFIMHWFLSKVSTLAFELPYSRLMEKEADEVGLKIAANACYDVREAAVFWGKFYLDDILHEDIITKSYRKKGVVLPPEFIRTHPL